MCSILCGNLALLSSFIVHSFLRWPAQLNPIGATHPFPTVPREDCSPSHGPEDPTADVIAAVKIFRGVPVGGLVREASAKHQ